MSGREGQDQSAPKDTAGYPGSVVEFPGGFDGAHPPNNLPLQLSSFVGRNREVAEIEVLLADNRLLTLTGPAGSGKTRLALAVAHEMMGSYEDGAWLVELAPLSDSELVSQALAPVLGVREAPGCPLIETLADHLGSKTVLIVLDNCEHVVGACASLSATLLRYCPKLSILATSRETLSVRGETLYVVLPLSLPDPRLPAADSLSYYEAARLFVERAKAVRPGFALTDSNERGSPGAVHRPDPFV